MVVYFHPTHRVASGNGVFDQPGMNDRTDRSSPHDPGPRRTRRSAATGSDGTTSGRCVTQTTLFRRGAWPALILASVVAGCASSSGEETAPTSAGRSFIAAPSARTPASAEGLPATGDVPEPILSDVLSDAEDRTGMDREAIEVVSADAVTWNDGSLGCPEPGQLYTQALVDGYHVVLQADGERLDYRIGPGGYRLCRLPSGPGDSDDD